MTDGKRGQRKVVINGRVVEVGERKKRRWKKQECCRKYIGDKHKSNSSFSEPQKLPFLFKIITNILGEFVPNTDLDSPILLNDKGPTVNLHAQRGELHHSPPDIEKIPSYEHSRSPFLINLTDATDPITLLLGYLTIETVSPDLLNFQQDNSTHDWTDLSNIFNRDDTDQKADKTRDPQHTNTKLSKLLYSPSPFPQTTSIVPEKKIFNRIISIRVFIQILPECTRSFRRLGIADPHEVIRLIDSMFQVADTCYCTGNFEKAEFWYRRIVTAKRKVRWFKPLETLKACAGVISCMGWQNKYLDAYEIMKDFLPSVQKILPHDHYISIVLKRVWTASLRETLDSKTLEHGYNALLELLQTCLSSFGMRHETTLQTVGDLGTYLLSLGSLRECESIIRVTLDLCQTNRSMGSTQVWTIEARVWWATMLQLAVALRKEKKFTEAESLLQSTWRSYGGLIRDSGQEWFDISYETAKLKYAAGKLAQSELLLREIFQRSSWDILPDQMLKLNLIRFMAAVLRDSEKYSEAAIWFEKELISKIVTYGVRSKKTLRVCKMLGFCYTREKMYSKAIAVLERTIGEVESSRGRGPLSADECVQYLRRYISKTITMRDEAGEYVSEEQHSLGEAHISVEVHLIDVD